jgi:hypothetical protein
MKQVQIPPGWKLDTISLFRQWAAGVSLPLSHAEIVTPAQRPELLLHTQEVLGSNPDPYPDRYFSRFLPVPPGMIKQTMTVSFHILTK